MEVPALLSAGPGNTPCKVVLAHGAGAPMDSPFMETVCRGLADAGIGTARFEFPYMARRRVDGKKRGPDPQATLLSSWEAVISAHDPERLVIGGKSLGGRMASMVAEEAGVAGVVCLGYPFHPPGRSERTRIEHLKKLTRPVLVLQGTRDPFGTPEDVAGYRLPENIDVRWVEDGEHSFIPRKKSGRTEAGNLAFAVEAMASFVRRVVPA